MPQWLLSTSMLSDLADVFSLQPCQAQMPSVRLKIAGVGTRGGSANQHPQAGTSSPAPGPPAESINTPGVGRARRAGERAAERDHAAHAIRHHLGELSCIEAAETPADQRDLAAMGVVHLLQELRHPVLHARPQAQIASLLPAARG